MAMTPEIVPAARKPEATGQFSGYRVKYLKVDFDDPVSVGELAEIETRALQEDDKIIVLNYEKFSFQTAYFMIVKYLEHDSI